MTPRVARSIGFAYQDGVTKEGHVSVYGHFFESADVRAAIFAIEPLHLLIQCLPDSDDVWLHPCIVEVSRILGWTLLRRSEGIRLRSRGSICGCALAVGISLYLRSAGLAFAAQPSSPTSIFAPASTAAKTIFGLSLFVLTVTGAVFLVVCALLLYSIVRFRKERNDDGREPPQVYGSSQVELAWTVIPILVVVALFMATARVIALVQKTPSPGDTIAVSAIGHQFWWEYRYPQLGVVTANELHLPVSDPAHPTPAFITLLSADTDHSFWVPRLGGKTDLIPNHPNTMWIDPQAIGIYLGQCGQYCGTQHAKMLLRVYVQSKGDFDLWIRQQRQPRITNGPISEGQQIFETTACINCHTVSGTVANGRFGPDLTHLMSRDTIAAGAATNTPQNLRLWIRKPDAIKPGSLMPVMQLSDQQLDALTAYLETLR